MSNNESSSSAAAENKKRLQALEAKAVAEATASADAAYTPSASLLNASSPELLLKQVDGPSLADYYDPNSTAGKESVYVGRSVPIAAGGSLTIPIQVSSPGSVVEYSVENKQYDFGFSITAEREEGVTIVKETTRVDASKEPITGKFLVGTVPCLIQFQFDNDFSWMREKVVSYKVTVTPPSLQTLTAGRRRRAKACLKAVTEDYQASKSRYQAASDQRTLLETELEQLKLEIAQKEKSLKVVVEEEKRFKDRLGLRQEQINLLQDRLENGWHDEQELKK
ncbi:hypothetical protein IV203_023151 [Nitzschia inconspicua]|uniref:GOLD domain-containing protein n=1 Tax=Nitzschia inconspicua TaxID=303405 RepID=A0A9K3PBU4_9STRA|nr:hypothetical protein IV203_023151 [Nitzschia inconspicua]